MKNNYSYFEGFTEDQFAANDHFRQWVLYAETEQEEFWNNYLTINPHQQPTILSARKKVEASLIQYGIQPLTTEEKLVIKHAIYHEINQPVKSFTLLRKTTSQLIKIAAVVSGIVMMTAYFLHKTPARQTVLLVQESTAAKETKEISLADSSVVILNGNSSISYKNDIGNSQNREITLKGNAYFKVKGKADHRSFTVRTNSISIAVHGTEFNVDARSKATEIVLTSGKVKVSADNNNSTAVYMSPGEKVQLDTLRHSFIKSKTNTSLYSPWTEGTWNFSSTSLPDIADLIYKYYGTKTVFANEKIKRLKISAVIPVTDLASFTNIISKTLDLKITEQHGQLYIQF